MTIKKITAEQNFLFNSIRKYNKAGRQTQRDVILHTIGVRAGLLERKRSPLPELSEEERQLALEHLRAFCKEQGVEILLKPGNSLVSHQ